MSCPYRNEDKPHSISGSISDMTGIEFEDFVRRSLHQEGFTRIETTPKSGDFGADLIVYGGSKDSEDSSRAKQEFCNSCLRKLPVTGCEWKSCIHRSVKARPAKIVVQCKRSTTPVGIAAIQEVLGAKSHYRAQEAWVVSNSTFTKAAQKLAKSCGVRLKQLRAPGTNVCR
jgi:restriction system protein